MKAKSFEFIDYKLSLQEKRIDFRYRINFYDKSSINFEESLIFPKKIIAQNCLEGVINKTLQSLHLMLGVSYYKLYCPSLLKHNYKLNRDEANFWNRVYTKGLGEFFYRNKINFRSLVRFPFLKNQRSLNAKSLKRKNRALVGIGGGKDSIVVAELLKKAKIDFTALSIESGNPYEVVGDVTDKIGVSKLVIKRVLDEKLFGESAKDGTYNGHIPVSAVYAFIGLAASLFYDFSYFIVGNERSSNFGNVRYLGEEINHQWSKSEEFEKMFREYVDNFIGTGFRYFSLLRPFYEIRIAKMFSGYDKYFSSFTSCNAKYKIHDNRCTTMWCGKCPKCVFVFIIMSAFLNKEKLIRVFGQNLYEMNELEPLFRDVLGFGKLKPFDCVGTFKEARVALFLAGKEYQNTYIGRKFLKKIKVTNRDVSEAFAFHESTNIPEQFILLIMNNILLLGYGKEGKATKKYLEKEYPSLKVGKADEKIQGKNYMLEQNKYDFAIKTPGIPKEKVFIPYTTATNIFFDKIGGGNKPLIIGITGSKGKSTTASLLYNVLKTAGKKVELLGNIGRPMLGYLLEGKKAEILVVELSSYQLDDIKFSPNIAVVTNLFPDHMTYHGGEDNYYFAKKNIIKFQDMDGKLFYNGRVKTLKSWSRESKGEAYDFAQTFVSEIKTNLKGEHNKSNIKAVVAVSKFLGIREEYIKKGIMSFIPLSHRLEFIGRYKDIDFYDDSISTTPDSTIAAIRSLRNISTIFLGGEDRGYDFRKLEKEVINSGIKNVVLFPESGRRMFSKEKGLKILRTNKMEQAVRFAYKLSKPGSICLLSTASPSYSLWKNFEEKGDEYKLWVKSINRSKARF